MQAPAIRQTGNGLCLIQSKIEVIAYNFPWVHLLQNNELFRF